MAFKACHANLGNITNLENFKATGSLKWTNKLLIKIAIELILSENYYATSISV